MTAHPDPFALSAAEIKQLLDTNLPLFPELESARSNLAALRNAPHTQIALRNTQALVENCAQLPQTSYTHYRLFRRTGDRKTYEASYFKKRAILTALALRCWLGDAQWKDAAQDYIWDICEESNWVLPAHENGVIDLFSAETGLLLAEILATLGDKLNAEVQGRVRGEIERRIFTPYLSDYQSLGWYKTTNNWNGVCNGAVAATFLLLEPQNERVAHAVSLALAGLKVFLDEAFESDGTSTEGVGYWQYGLSNFILLSEMLHARSNGQIDLLRSEKMQRIAAYPAKVLLSGNHFASFSDCDETVVFHPGLLVRLNQRSGEDSLQALLAAPNALEAMTNVHTHWRLYLMLRDLLWWNGERPQAAPLQDAVMDSAGVARFVAQTPHGTPLVLALKAGHNAEHHNQNDVGSFIVHAGGENLLVDPGRGLYTRAYFGAQRYENIFANSYGHSVPRIGGTLQSAGREFEGELLEVVADAFPKRARMEFARAYPVENLISATREFTIESSGAIVLHDSFQFEGEPRDVEEAFVTSGDVQIDGATAILRGEKMALRLNIEEPEIGFTCEALESASRENNKPQILKRLTFTLPIAHQCDARVRIEVVE